MPLDDMIARLNPHDVKVLLHSSDGLMVYPARTIAEETGLSVYAVRKAQRHLRGLGLLLLGFLMHEDNNELCGRGYSTTIDGARVKQELQRRQKS